MRKLLPTYLSILVAILAAGCSSAGAGSDGSDGGVRESTAIDLGTLTLLYSDPGCPNYGINASFVRPTAGASALYFGYRCDFGGFGVRSYDGTVSDLDLPTGYTGGFYNPVNVDGKVLFWGDSTTVDEVLYAIAGQNISQLTGTNYESGYFSPVLVDGYLYFIGDNTSNWVSIYRTNGVSLVEVARDSEVPISEQWSRQTGKMVEFQGDLYLGGETGPDGDGNQEETLFAVSDDLVVRRLEFTNRSDWVGGVDHLTAIDDKLYFIGTGANGPDELRTRTLYYFDGQDIQNADSGFWVGNIEDAYYWAHRDQLLLHRYGTFFRYPPGGNVEHIDEGGLMLGGIFDNPITYKGKLYFEGSVGGSGGRHIVSYDGSGFSIPSVGTSGYRDDFLQPVVWNGALLFRGNVSYGFYTDGLTITKIEDDLDEYGGFFGWPTVYEGSLLFEGLRAGGGDAIFAFN